MDEAWKTFFVSGKVDDYLEWKKEEGAGTQECAARRERPDGTEYCSDRNGLKCNANWRL